jgi:hypothetical protein
MEFNQANGFSPGRNNNVGSAKDSRIVKLKRLFRSMSFDTGAAAAACASGVDSAARRLDRPARVTARSQACQGIVSPRCFGVTFAASELIAYTKAKAGKVDMASAGTGSAPDMAGELFNVMAGINMVHVLLSHVQLIELGGLVLSALLVGDAQVDHTLLDQLKRLLECCHRSIAT